MGIGPGPPFFARGWLSHSMMSSQRDPLPLETQCLLHLLCHLETFPPKSLASLPVRLRQRLLANLPIADICVLEQTAVVDGVDMDQLWYDILVKCTKEIVPEESRRASTRPSEYKALFFQAVVRKIFMYSWAYPRALNGKDVLSLVFAVEYPLDLHLAAELPAVSSDDYLDPQHVRFVPQHHRKHFKLLSADESFDSVMQLDLIVQNCKYCPPYIKIRYVDTGRVFTPPDDITKQHLIMLTNAFREVSKLEFSDFYDRMCPSLQLILEAVLSSTRKAPSIYLSLPVTPLCVVAPMFYGSNYDPLYFGRDTLQLPCTGLRHLAVRAVNGIPYPAETEIKSIIYTGLLEKLELFQNGCFCAPSLVPDLSVLILQPQFTLLKIENSPILSSCIAQLIETFLTTPATHQQKLHFKDITVVGKVSSAAPGTGTLPDSNIEHKFLSLCFSGGGSFISDLLTWVFGRPHIRLNTLEVATCPGAIATIGQHTNLQIQNLSFDCIYPKSSLQPLVCLLDNSALNSLQMAHCFFSRNSNLSYLTEGLRRQAKVGSLKKFSLSRDEIGEQPDDQLSRFFDAMFSLKGPELQLSLSNCGFSHKHVELTRQSWDQYTASTETKSFELCDSQNKTVLSLNL